MDKSQETRIFFNSKEYVCKFGFKYRGMGSSYYHITGNMYQNEIAFEFYNYRNDNMTDIIGFQLSSKDINELLPLLKISEFEKYRDLPVGWDYKLENGHNGYRDGWGYDFWYISESGIPLFQIHMSSIFIDSMKPPYEKLLDWIRANYKGEKSLKDKYILW